MVLILYNFILFFSEKKIKKLYKKNFIFKINWRKPGTHIYIEDIQHWEYHLNPQDESFVRFIATLPTHGVWVRQIQKSRFRHLWGRITRRWKWWYVFYFQLLLFFMIFLHIGTLEKNGWPKHLFRKQSSIFTMTQLCCCCRCCCF